MTQNIEGETNLPKLSEDLLDYGKDLLKNPNRTYQDEDIALQCFEKLIGSGKLSSSKLSSVCEDSAWIYLNRQPKTNQNYEKTIEMLKKSISYSGVDPWSKSFYLLEVLTAHPELYGFSKSLAGSSQLIKNFREKAGKILCGEGLYQTAIKWAQHVVIEQRNYHSEEDIETLEYYVHEAIHKYWHEDITSVLYCLKGMIHHYFRLKNRRNFDKALKCYKKSIAHDKSLNGNKLINGKPLAYFHYRDLASSPQSFGFDPHFFDQELADSVSKDKLYFLINGGITSYRIEVERLLGNQSHITSWVNYYLGRLTLSSADIQTAFTLCNEAVEFKNVNAGEVSYMYTLKGWMHQHLLNKDRESFNKALENYVFAIVSYKKMDKEDYSMYWAIQRAFECLLPLMLNPVKFGYSSLDATTKEYRSVIEAIDIIRENVSEYNIGDDIKLGLYAFVRLNSSKPKKYDPYLADREAELIINCIYCKRDYDSINAMKQKVLELSSTKDKLIEIQNDPKQDSYYLGFMITFSKSFKMAEDISLQKTQLWKEGTLPALGNKIMDYLPLIGDDVISLDQNDLIIFFSDLQRFKKRACNLWQFAPDLKYLEGLVQEAMFERIKTKSDEIQSAVNDQNLRDWYQNLLAFHSTMKSVVDPYIRDQPMEFFMGVKDAALLINQSICKGKIFTGKPPGYHTLEYRIGIVCKDQSVDSNDISRSFIRTLETRRSASFLRFLSTRTTTANVNEQVYQPEVESPKKEEIKKIKKSSACCSIF